MGTIERSSVERLSFAVRMPIISSPFHSAHEHSLFFLCKGIAESGWGSPLERIERAHHPGVHPGDRTASQIATPHPPPLPAHKLPPDSLSTLQRVRALLRQPHSAALLRLRPAARPPHQRQQRGRDPPRRPAPGGTCRARQVDTAFALSIAEQRDDPAAVAGAGGRISAPHLLWLVQNFHLQMASAERSTPRPPASAVAPSRAGEGVRQAELGSVAAVWDVASISDRLPHARLGWDRRPGAGQGWGRG
jgi:hypothetical protein